METTVRPRLPLEVGAESLGEVLLGGLEDVGGSRGGVNLDDLALLLELVHDRHARLDEGLEALADALGVVVGAAAGLATLQQAALHDLLGAVEEEDELGGADALFELVSLVELTGEAIDKEAALLGATLLEGLGHGVLEELNGHLHGNNKAVLDVVADEVTELGTGALLLSTQQVAGRKMNEAMLGDESGALGSLAGTGTTEDEKNGDVVGGEGRDGLSWRGELARRLGFVDSGSHLW